MKYSRFEALMLAVGSIVITATVVASLREGPIVEEAIAQSLLLVVLVGAAHWGRNGGFAAAAAASLGYIALRIPLVVSTGLTGDVVSLLLVRLASYGIVGIVGGEVCGRIKYLFARLEESTNVDELTHLFNERFAGRLLANGIGNHVRYEMDLSVVILELSPNLTSELRPSRERSTLHAVAERIRGDVRLVDDVGRLSDGRFMVILPHTKRDGADVVAERLAARVRDLLGARDESVHTEVLATPDDLGVLREFASRLGASPPEPRAYPSESGS